jgi:hypothetical protein
VSTAVPSKRCTDVATFLRILHADPATVVEVRIPRCPNQKGSNFRDTSAGYFQLANAAKAASEIARFEQAEPAGIYCTINPVDPSLLARCANRIGKAKQTTSDSNILRRQWLFLDIDSIRPAGVSATETEMSEACRLASQMRRQLKAEGWPQPVRGIACR